MTAHYWCFEDVSAVIDACLPCSIYMPYVEALKLNTGTHKVVAGEAMVGIALSTGVVIEEVAVTDNLRCLLTNDPNCLML